MFSIPTDLAPECAPLAWLVGRWDGSGVGGYPTIDSFEFAQELTFEHNGKPFLSYRSKSWLIDEQGARVRPLATEAGFWRPQPGGQLEVLLTHPTGYAEVWLGEVDGPRVELRTDVVARTTSAKDYTAGHRMYGLVESDLLWAFDMAASGEPLQPHLSARLARVE